MANCWTCSGVKVLQIRQSCMHRSSPTPLFLQRTHFKWLSKTAIIWPQVPCFCHGDDIVFTEHSRISVGYTKVQLNFKFVKYLQISQQLESCRKYVCTLHVPNEKDAIMSDHLDRKQRMRHLANAHSMRIPAGGNTG